MCYIPLYFDASDYDYHSVKDKLNELKSKGIIDDRYKIIKPIQEVFNFVIDWDDSEYECNDPGSLHPLRWLHLKLKPKLWI